MWPLAHQADRLAIVSGGTGTTYAQLDRAADAVASALSGGDLDEARVAVFVPPCVDWAAAVLGIWRAGGVAVPLALSHPPAELEYVMRDSGATAVIVDEVSTSLIALIANATGARQIDLGGRFLSSFDQNGGLRGKSTSEVDFSSTARRALILYTSGTTGRPKGVVTTHANIDAQVTSLRTAWEWSAADRALLVLPLHHVHGIVNVVLSALASGAGVEMLPKFDATTVWNRLSSGDITVFTAVPTMYHRLIAAWDQASNEDQRVWARVKDLRLMMSGSAALPVGTLTRWREITGHTLLERYGMTEIGMGLSNPLHGERRPGHVGSALPGVKVRLVNEIGEPVADGEPGEVEVSGPTVFREYWQRPDETAAAFRDGWFRTGDVAVIDRGSYRLLGRRSTDIIKTGGYKVSALEIEEVLREHPAVLECAVVGVADPEWGERVSAAVEVRPGLELDLDGLQAFAKTRLAPYKVPRALVCVAALPRNAMGKVVKPDVAAMVAASVT